MNPISVRIRTPVTQFAGVRTETASLNALRHLELQSRVVLWSAKITFGLK